PGKKKHRRSSLILPTDFKSEIDNLELLDKAPHRNRSTSMNPLKSKKAIWWSIGFGALMLGVLAYTMFAPHVATPFDPGAPDVDVPSMRNTPDNPGALQIDVQDPEEKQAQQKQ